MRHETHALSLSAILTFSPALAFADAIVLIDSFGLGEGTDLTGWTMNVVAAPSGTSTELCGYGAKMATVTAIAPDRVRVVTAQVWMVDTSGATITPAQRLSVTTVSDCANVPGMWLLKLADAGNAY